MRLTEGLGRYAWGRRRGLGGRPDAGIDSEIARVSLRGGILGSSQKSHLPPPPEREEDKEWVDPGLVEHTIPGERPHPKAQWDDAEGRWIIWDRELGKWVPVG